MNKLFFLALATTFACLGMQQLSETEYHSHLFGSNLIKAAADGNKENKEENKEIVTLLLNQNNPHAAEISVFDLKCALELAKMFQHTEIVALLTSPSTNHRADEIKAYEATLPSQRIMLERALRQHAAQPHFCLLL